MKVFDEKLESAVKNTEKGYEHIRGTLEDPLLMCLMEILSFHGRPSSPQALTHGLPLVNQRLTPSLLERAAARANFVTRIAQRDVFNISSELLPAIVLLAGDSAAILLKQLDSERFLIQYPEYPQPLEVSKKQLEENYAGYVLFVFPRFNLERRSKIDLREKGGHWFWSVVWGSKRIYRDAIMAAVLINIFALAIPVFSMNVYDRVVPNNATETLWVLALGVGAVLIFNFLLTTARAYVVDTASKRIDVKLSSKIFEQILDIRMEERPASVGAFSANLRSFESVRDFIASASLTTVVDLPFIFIFLSVLVWISPWMIFPPLVAIFAVLTVSFYAQAKMEVLTKKTFQASAQRNALLVESLTNLGVIKSLNAQGGIQKIWEEANRFIASIGGKTKFISSMNVNFVQAMQQLVTIAVVIIGVYLVQISEISLGGIIAASMIAGRCIAPLGQVAGLMMQYQNAKTSLAAIDGYMKMPVEHVPGGDFVSRPSLYGAIDFRNVCFSYPGNDAFSLNKINLSIKPGERIGVIGRVGSGKSTLEKLILGLYQPQEGSILMDGVDARQIDPIDLRRAVGHVQQDPALFYGTLKYNLLMAAPYASEMEMLYAARISGVDDFAALHPQGYEMHIGERGESLSGGQRQAIAIAQALIKNPSILLFDEPSSNLDNQSEALLKRKIKDCCVGKTLILITHRTSLLDLVDRLLVVDGGCIVADGPKEQIVEALKAGRINRAGAHG